MRERIRCVFLLVRYVPDAVRGEFVNIGVILRQAMSGTYMPGAEPAIVRFTRDWSRVLRFDPLADIGLLQSLEADLLGRLQEEADHPASKPDPKSLLGTLRESLSNSIQMTEQSGCLAESLDDEMNRLMRMYVD